MIARMIGRFENGTVVAGHIDWDTNEFRLYRPLGNTDVYSVKEASISDVLIGDLLRTEYDY